MASGLPISVRDRMAQQQALTDSADALALATKVAQAQAFATAAVALAANARQMAININGQITPLQQVAAQFGSVTTAADATHQQLQDEITALQNRAAVPGPAGADGQSAYQAARDGGYGGTQTQWLATLKGADGAAGAKGTTGDVGPAGTANLTIGAVPVSLLALGGSTTVTITLASAMPNATYNLRLAHTAVVNLSNVTLTGIVKTTTTVQVKVTSVGLALAAGTLIAVAW